MLNSINDTTSQRALMASELTPLSVLREDFDRESVFQKQLDFLQKNGFSSVRRVRGDGDCFYRSFAFSFLEQLIDEPDREFAVMRRLSLLDGFEPSLKSAGFDKDTYQDFKEEFEECIKAFAQPDHTGRVMNLQSLVQVFQDEMKSHAIVFYLRLITSMKIYEDQENMAPFLMNPETFDPMSPTSFRRRQIEVMGVEADEPQIIALTNAMKVNVEVAYVDGHTTSDIVKFVRIHNAQDENSRSIMLLYRPGHYDVLNRGKP
ncbi:cysteine proteinase [Pluteus cervinus]|uniref:Cysteine proteinase n=1 Tax=Pluteus cervinus TaxID=181527 RepID=A0ACD3B8Y0_9AGAR|nr:cysteine proteinase [Pluteus cervinus]